MLQTEGSFDKHLFRIVPGATLKRTLPSNTTELTSHFSDQKCACTYQSIQDHLTLLPPTYLPASQQRDLTHCWPIFPQGSTQERIAHGGYLLLIESFNATVVSQEAHTWADERNRI